MKNYIGDCDKRCSCCKKYFSLFFYDTRDYVYKVKVDKKYLYQCSYPCYKKEKEKYANIRNASKRPSTKGC